MATLADLFASSQAPNAQTQLLAPKVAFQRPGGFNKTFGTIMDVLAAMGGAKPGYSTGIDARENAYNQSMKQQQFQNVFRNFVENPDDPATLANLAEVNPDAFLKVAPQNKVVGDSVVRMGPFGAPQVALAGAGAGGSQPREVVIAKMLADPTVAPEVKSRLEGLLAPKERQATGSDFQIVETPQGYVRVSRLTGDTQPLGIAPPPRATGGGPATTMFERRAEAIRKQFGEDAYAQFIATGKFTPPGGGSPGNTQEIINQARSLLPVATSGGLPAAAATAQGFVGIGTKAMEADEQLNVLGARLVATVPRFEGPQSDKDTALYRQAAADVANPAKPRNVRIAALNTVERLNQRAARRPGAAPAQGQRLSPTEAAKLAPGTPFIGLDGKPRVRQ